MTDHPPLGRFVTQRLNVEKRRIKKSPDSDGYAGVYVPVARAIVEKYPELTDFERRAVFASLKADADRMNCAAIQTLDDVARVLNVK